MGASTVSSYKFSDINTVKGFCENILGMKWEGKLTIWPIHFLPESDRKGTIAKLYDCANPGGQRISQTGDKVTDFDTLIQKMHYCFLHEIKGQGGIWNFREESGRGLLQVLKYCEQCIKTFNTLDQGKLDTFYGVKDAIKKKVVEDSTTRKGKKRFVPTKTEQVLDETVKAKVTKYLANLLTMIQKWETEASKVQKNSSSSGSSSSSSGGTDITQTTKVKKPTRTSWTKLANKNAPGNAGKSPSPDMAKTMKPKSPVIKNSNSELTKTIVLPKKTTNNATSNSFDINGKHMRVNQSDKTKIMGFVNDKWEELAVDKDGNLILGSTDKIFLKKDKWETDAKNHEYTGPTKKENDDDDDNFNSSTSSAKSLNKSTNGAKQSRDTKTKSGKKFKYYYQTNTDDKVYEIELDSDATVGSFKKTIRELENLDEALYSDSKKNGVNNIKVIFAGKDLLTDIVLKDLNVGNTSLYVYIRPLDDIFLMTAKALRPKTFIITKKGDARDKEYSGLKYGGWLTIDSNDDMIYDPEYCEDNDEDDDGLFLKKGTWESYADELGYRWDTKEKKFVQIKKSSDE